MDEDRNIGVTEARFALTLLICVLAATGFFVLMRLSGPVDSTIEVGLDPVGPPPIVQRTQEENQPRVLPLDGSEPTTDRTPEIAVRPMPPHQDGNTSTEPPMSVADPDSAREAQRR